MSLPQLQRTFDKDDATTELRDALAIVAELSPPDDLRVPVFNIAAQLLTQRAQVAPGMPFDIDAMLASGQIRLPGGKS